MKPNLMVLTKHLAYIRHSKTTFLRLSQPKYNSLHRPPTGHLIHTLDRRQKHDGFISSLFQSPGPASFQPQQRIMKNLLHLLGPILSTSQSRRNFDPSNQ